jgi:septal ring factor EnvC (AmiA/AmiB activator)
MDMISTYWEQILLIGALIFHAARSYAQISEMRKDIDSLQTEVRRYTDLTQRQSEQLVQLRAEMDVVNKQVTSLWEFTNGLRDRLNGHSKH